MEAAKGILRRLFEFRSQALSCRGVGATEGFEGRKSALFLRRVTAGGGGGAVGAPFP